MSSPTPEFASLCKYVAIFSLLVLIAAMAYGCTRWKSTWSLWRKMALLAASSLSFMLLVGAALEHDLLSRQQAMQEAAPTSELFSATLCAKASLRRQFVSHGLVVTKGDLADAEATCRVEAQRNRTPEFQIRAEQSRALSTDER